MKVFAGVFFSILFSFSLLAQTNFHSLSYSSYFGGEKNDVIEDVAVDSNGNIYIVGTTSSDDFNYPNPIQSTYLGGFSDVFVAMLSPDAREVLAFTYFGGDGRDEARSIAIQDGKNVVITGVTNSDNLPNSAFTMKNMLTDGVEGFVGIMDSGLTTYRSSTYLGGTFGGFDLERLPVAVADDGEIFVAFSASPEITEVLVPVDTAKELSNGIVYALHELLAGGNNATFVGGSDYDNISDIKLSKDGSAIYLAGWSSSMDLPGTGGSLQDTSNGATDAFVTKLNADFTLNASTYFGGNSFDKGISILEQADGSIMLSGITYSDSFCVGLPGLRDSLGFNVSDLFTLNMSSDLSTKNRFTYIGGANIDRLNKVIQGKKDDLILVGSTLSSNFPVPFNGGNILFGRPEDGFAIQVDASLANIITGTYIGDTMQDVATSVVLTQDNQAIVTGFTNSVVFPLSADAEDAVFAGLSEGFITSFGLYVGGVESRGTVSSIKLNVYGGERVSFSIPAGMWQLQVFDLMGRKVKAQSLGFLGKGEYEKSLSLREKGFYIIRLISENESISRKFFAPGR